jgi:hypothetical protein
MKQPSNKRIRAARSTDALSRLTAEFDRENVVDEFHALSPASRRKWATVKRKPGRPRKGLGVKVISISVERTLLARSDAVARRMGVTRAGLIERGLKAILAARVFGARRRSRGQPRRRWAR